MTREEAIMWLIKPTVTSTEISVTKAKEIEAYNIATKLLSAASRGDLIRRQDAVNTIKRYKYRLEGCGQTYEFLLEEFEKQIPTA